jgi:tRNA(Ile2) C34 agmatinyltransferase TiaS
MICPKCGGDTFITGSDVDLKCENCGYIYRNERKKMNKYLLIDWERILLYNV